MTIRFSRRHGAWLLVVLVGLMPVRALGEPNVADLDAARGLYVEGLRLRDAGKLDGSLARFKAAHALAATPITSLELGRAYALVAQLVEARDVLLSVERMPVLGTESPKAGNARIEARAMLERVTERMPTLRIVFAHEPTLSPHVTIDGAPIAGEASWMSQKLNPGPQVLVAGREDGARADHLDTNLHTLHIKFG